MSDAGRTSLVGHRLGVYQVLAPLGTGGMGEVYRARDTRLGRDVALKFLRRDLTTDADLVTRFEREARVLAALNHPHIAAIYGLEDVEAPSADSRGRARALVMELVEGDTLAAWIRSHDSARRTKASAITETLRIARQIADALDAAHEKGVVHRDLKPANIKITPAGVAKVLDFGLAKLAPGGDTSSVATAAPTMPADDTREGLILGTVAYMSPEQARGQPVDKRTDIWSFGCVVYEMLTGRAVFARQTITHTLAAILDDEPDWEALPRGTPPAVQRLLRRCLEKNLQHRLRDVADARSELDEAAGTRPGAERARTRIEPTRTRFATMAAAAAAVVAAVGAVAWVLTRPAASSPPQPVTRTTVTLPAGQELDTENSAGPLAIAPNGRQLAFVARSDGRAQLYVRNLDGFATTLVPGTEGARYPFFSPDSEWVGFFAERKLKRVSTRGGAPLTICDVPVLGRGGTWAPDGTIVFDPGESGLMRVTSGGGTPEPLKTGDASMDAKNLSWPQFLPDGRALLVTVGAQGVPSELAVLSLGTGEWRQLGLGSQAQYVPSGHLVYHAPAVREGELDAVAFDAQTLTVHGTPMSVIDGVFRAQSGGGAYFAASRNGTLIFSPGGYARTLVQVDRNGRRTPITDDRRGFRHPDVSPDGKRVAVAIDPRPSQIWVYDLSRRSGSLVTADAHNVNPIWSADGRRVTYSTRSDIFWKTADGGTAAEKVVGLAQQQYPTGWSSDGRWLIFEVSDGDDYDIWVKPEGEEPRPLIATPTYEARGRLSPDGRWLAYNSNETGRFEVYVRPFPDVNAGKWTVSTNGGGFPMWSPTSRELFWGLGSTLMAVKVDSRGSTFVAGTPEQLFTGPFDITATQFAVMPDGEHFVMVEADPSERPTQVHVVLNWMEELTRLVPSAPR